MGGKVKMYDTTVVQTISSNDHLCVKGLRIINRKDYTIDRIKKNMTETMTLRPKALDCFYGPSLRTTCRKVTKTDLHFKIGSEHNS